MATNQPHTKRDEGGQGDKQKAKDGGNPAKDQPGQKSQGGGSKGKNAPGGDK